MAKMVNLRQARKNQARAQKQAAAAQARAKSGRTLAERKLDAGETENANRQLDGHRLTGKDA
jgi:hypothetical protein